MSIMEVQELQCYRVSKNFPELNSDTCSCDNDFAVIVQNGVHILSLTPNLMDNEENIKVQRSFIKPPPEYLPDIPVDFTKLSRKELCMLTLDWKLTPVLDKSLPAGIYIRQIGFLNCKPPTKSLLGVISNQGRFQLFGKFRYDWEKVTDISSLWNDHCASERFSTKKIDFDSKVAKQKCLQFVAFTYCRGFLLDEGKPSSLLIAISQNGTASFWKLENGEASLINSINLGISVYTLNWHYLTDRFGWVIASCYDGSVKIYFCKKNAKNEVMLTLLHELWKETDQALASNLKVCKQGNRSLLVFSKENALLLFALQNNQIGSYRHDFDKKISGLEILDDSCIFVILTDHQTYNISIENEKCVCVPVPFKIDASFSKYAVRGVSFSRNHVFCAISFGNIRNFDPNLNKEPSCILLCTTRKDISFPTVQNLIKEISLCQAYDCIEYFRVSCVENKTKVSQEIPTNFEAIVKENIGECYRDVQAIFILSRCCRYTQSKDDLFNIEIFFTICSFIHHCQSIADNRRHYYFQQWLSANSQKLPTFLAEHQQIKSILDKANDTNGYIAEEKCDICLAVITDHSNVKCIVCERGHKVLRCSRSFLPVTLQPHYSCTLCHAILLKSEEIFQCVICDNYL